MALGGRVDGTTGVGRQACASTRNTMRERPIVMTESGSSTASFTGAPFSWVPFVEPRSAHARTAVPLHLGVASAPESSRVTSASLPRPMTVRPFRIG